MKTKRRGGIKNIAILLCLALLFGVVSGGGFVAVRAWKDNDDKAVSGGQDEIQTPVTTKATPTPIPAESLSVSATDLSSVVENVLPALVSINVKGTTVSYDFFGRAYEQESSGSGSGIIVGQTNEELLIVTNNHVVADTSAVEIVFTDDSSAAATVKGLEPEVDLAVVAVALSDISEETAANIRIAALGNSDTLQLGEMVIAVGNALGYGLSTTVGYVSALEREVMIDGVTYVMIQTDAAINPGNSGGALFNTNGEVVGINSAKISGSTVESVGYAIPISDAIPIIDELMNRETLDEAEIGYVGIDGTDVSQTASRRFGMPAGLYVTLVAEGSPAEQAGIRERDVIVGVNNRTIETKADLEKFLSYTRAGTEVTFHIRSFENGEYVEKEVKLVLGRRSAA